jgi:hypothetical protein
MKLWNNYFVIIDESVTRGRKVVAVIESHIYYLIRKDNWQNTFASEYPDQADRFNVVKVYAPNADTAKRLAWNDKVMCINCEKCVKSIENEENCCDPCFDLLWSKEYARVAHYQAIDHAYVFGCD